MITGQNSSKDYSSNNLNINVTESVVNFDKSLINFKVPHFTPYNFNFFWSQYCEGSQKTYKWINKSKIFKKKQVCLLTMEANNSLQMTNKTNIHLSKKQKPVQFGTWLRWKNNEDRFYYQNKKTGKIQWNQPKEVKQRLDKSNWIEYKTLKGISFYCNILTKQQTYKRPLDININEQLKLPLVLFFKKHETKNETKIPLKDISKMKMIKINWVNTVQKDVTTINNKRLRQLVDNSVINYPNKKERRKAFIDLLKEKDVKFDEKWEKILKRIINDVRYRAIKTLKLRKEFFLMFQKDILEEKKRKK